MRRIMMIAVAAVALTLAGCSSAAPGGELEEKSPSAAAETADALGGELAVSAAASLKGAFDEAIQVFSEEHPDVRVTATYDGSSTLATQIDGGARVDVFASADEANMAKVTDAALAVDPVIFAKNTLVVVVPADNPADISSLRDLSAADVKLVLCAPEVPCGAASQRLLTGQSVDVAPVSLEQNVTAVLTKVRTGEADAGLVYKTDAATAADEVVSFTPDGAEQIVNAYPIVALSDAPNAEAAQAFVAFITGAEGQRILAAYGFDAP